jgi:hypothetical protein
MPPPSPLAAVNELRWAAALLAEHGGERGARFAAKVAEYETGAKYGQRLDETFGLTPAPGCEPWWATEAREERARLIRIIAVEFHSELPSARQLAKALRRYEGAGWIRDRPYRNPPSRASELDKMLFRVLKATGRSLGVRAIQEILAPCALKPGVFAAHVQVYLDEHVDEPEAAPPA